MIFELEIALENKKHCPPVAQCLIHVQYRSKKFHYYPAVPQVELLLNKRSTFHCTSGNSLGAHAQRGLRVCVSVKSHLTYGASVRPENTVTYSAGNEDQNICGVFSENAPLQS